MFKRLTLGLCAAALVWSGYWFWGASSLERTYRQWFEDRRGEGWQAEYSELALRGFPNRFDATWQDLNLMDPDTGLGWQAPFFQLFMLSYQPNHVIAVWPERHDIVTPAGVIEITSQGMQASLRREAAAALPLVRANLAADSLTLRDLRGGVTALAALRLGVERREGTEQRYRIAAVAEGLALSAPVLQQLSRDLPDAFKTARLDMEVEFDRPWDMRALEQARPQPRALALSMLEAEWGPMQLRMTGDLEIDPQGVPTGDLALQLRDWRAMLDLARQTGALPNSLARNIEDGLSLLAGLSGNGATLDLELNLRRGQVFLGPLPLGAAPRLRLR